MSVANLTLRVCIEDPCSNCASTTQPIHTWELTVVEHVSFRWFLGFFSRNSIPAAEPQRKIGFRANDFDRIATVAEKIDPYHRGRVRYQGTYWYAMLSEDAAVFPGDRVLVIGREAMTLIVQPFEALHSPQCSQSQALYDGLEEERSESIAAPYLRLVKSNLASDMTSGKGA